MIKDNEIQSLQQGHRTRLRKKFLDGQLAEYEILELLLTYAIPRRDVRTLSRQLYKKYGNLHNLFSASYEVILDGNNDLSSNGYESLSFIITAVTAPPGAENTSYSTLTPPILIAITSPGAYPVPDVVGVTK